MDLLDALIEPIMEESVGIARDDDHAPLVLLIKNDEVHRVPIPPTVHPRDALPVALRIYQPEAYLTVTEGRVLRGIAKDELLDGFQRGEIADNPDNTTVLAITAVERGGPARTWLAEATREDFPREFGDWEEISGEQSGTLVITEW